MDSSTSTRYRIKIDNPQHNTHLGIPMINRPRFTYGAGGCRPLVAAVLARIERDGAVAWRVVLATHSEDAAKKLMSSMCVGGHRATVVAMEAVTDPEMPRGTRNSVVASASANERRADLARASQLADSGRVWEARQLLAKHSLSYIAVAVVVGTDGVGKVRQ